MSEPTLTYTGTGTGTTLHFIPDMVWVKPTKDEDGWTHIVTTAKEDKWATAEDMQKASKAIQCILQVLTTAQKKKFVSLYTEGKEKSDGE